MTTQETETHFLYETTLKQQCPPLTFAIEQNSSVYLLSPFTKPSALNTEMKISCRLNLPIFACCKENTPISTSHTLHDNLLHGRSKHPSSCPPIGSCVSTSPTESLLLLATCLNTACIKRPEQIVCAFS